MKVNWRGWNRTIHRDVGYLCVGLTLAYAVSGVLLNHLHDWNSNYRFEKVSRRIPPHPDPDSFSEAHVPALLGRIGEKEKPRGIFRPDPRTVQVFLEGGRVIIVDLISGEVTGEMPKSRPVLSQMNFLHLNRAGRTWTIVSDLYAAALFFLAVTGLFILRGAQGITGRGAWLTLAGLAIPLLAALLLLP